jgi:hypothetical protein
MLRLGKVWFIDSLLCTEVRPGFAACGPETIEETQFFDRTPCTDGQIIQFPPGATRPSRPPDREEVFDCNPRDLCEYQFLADGVQPGDTLSENAERFGITVERLARLNGIENPDLIFAGQSLPIPQCC